MAIASGTCGTCSWNIDDNGKLTIQPTSGNSGELEANWPLFDPAYPWGQYAERIKQVTISGNITTKINIIGMTISGQYKYMFQGYTNLTTVNGLGNLKGATDVYCMFDGCSSLTNLDINNFDTSQVTEFGHMFDDCKSLTSLNLTNMNTSKNTSVFAMFSDCNLLSAITFGNNFYIKPCSQYGTIEDAWCSFTSFGGGKNLANGIIVTSNEAFSELTNAQRAGTWQRNVSFTYRVSAYRSTSGTADEDGENASFDIQWATNATTTDRIFRIYQKEAGAVSYPTSPVLTQNVTGNSGNTTLTINNIGDNAYDFKVEFYDGTNTYLAFPSIQTNIRLITIDKTGNICLYLNTSASSGTTDAKLYDAIVALGWQGDVLV